ncbi:hypothetical protein YA0002_17940 [Pseudomonas cichorii]|nr:hypothetical protein [Pseudomonas cichorii]
MPRFHAQQDFQNSTFAYAHAHGINGIELDALAQAIQRLMKHSNTIITNNQAESLQTMAELGYIKLEPTTQGTQQVDLLCPSALLSSYFWSVWVPHHLQSRGYQVAVLPNLEPVGEVQHCTVVFRVIGTRESSSDFLVKLAEKFNDQQEAEIVHIQAGHLDQYQGGRT